MKIQHRTHIEPLEARIAPATIIVAAGVLIYTDDTGVANSVALSTSGGSYTISDSGEVITLGAGTFGFTGGGTNTVTAPNASI